MSDVHIAGAGGYIGSRLVPELVAAGYAVRAGFRDPGQRDGSPGIPTSRLSVSTCASRPCSLRLCEMFAACTTSCTRWRTVITSGSTGSPRKPWLGPPARPTWTGSSTSPG